MIYFRETLTVEYNPVSVNRHLGFKMNHLLNFESLSKARGWKSDVCGNQWPAPPGLPTVAKEKTERGFRIRLYWFSSLD